MRKERFCDICGISSEYKKVYFYKKYNRCLCQKHYFQLENHGIIIDRTQLGCRDRNVFIERGSFFEGICQNRKGEITGSFLIDKEDFEKVSKLKWNIREKGEKLKSFYVVSGQSIYLHRFVLNVDSSVEIDHINGNGLDNRKNNLRASNRNIQLINTRQRENRTGFRGVYFDKRNNKYSAGIQYKGDRIYLKQFDSIDKAIYARLLLEKIIFPEQELREDIHVEYKLNITDKDKFEIEEYIKSKLEY